MIYLDTHVVLWLYTGLLDKIPAVAKKHLDNDDLCISPLVQLELEYLHEIKRITRHGADIVNELSDKLALVVSQDPLMKIVQIASQLHWTRDPFDRLIVATAKLNKAFLITKDTSISQHYSHIIWEKDIALTSNL